MGVSKGNIPWNKGKVGIYSKEYIEKLRKSHLNPSKELRKRISETLKTKGIVPPSRLGVRFTKEQKAHLSFKKQERKKLLGYINSPETRKKISLARKGMRFTEEHKANISKNRRGKGMKEQHYLFKVDRNELKTDRRHAYDSRYKIWMRQVKNRDGWKCRITNQECSGRMEAHHILGWMEYPELRYQINNGITLCHFHHPRKRSDEKILSPFFQDLVIVKAD